MSAKAILQNWSRWEGVMAGAISGVAGIVGGIVGTYLLPRYQGTSFEKDLLMVLTAGLGLLLVLFGAAVRILYMTYGDLSQHVARLASDGYQVQVGQDPAPREGTTSKSTAFDYCNSCVAKAKREILVISPHFPSGMDVLPETESHDRYLNNDGDGVTALLRRHVQSGQGILRYKRILQIDDGDLLDVRNGVIAGHLIRNDALRKHLAEAMALANANRSKIELVVVARKYTPSLPSILIIDDEHVFFSLPTNGTDARNTATKYDFVLSIRESEPSRPIVENFKGMFNQFSHGAPVITHIST
jgi:hypothetical protein